MQMPPSLKNSLYLRVNSERLNSMWYSKLEDLLNEDNQYLKKGKEVPFTVFITNEFFDALPITIL